MAVGITADFIGLMVITLERYFKIVHAITHRVLPQLDDQSGCGTALDRWSVYEFANSAWYNKSREWTMPEIGCLAKRSHGKGKCTHYPRVC